MTCENEVRQLLSYRDELLKDINQYNELIASYTDDLITIENMFRKLMSEVNKCGGLQ